MVTGGSPSTLQGYSGYKQQGKRARTTQPMVVKPRHLQVWTSVEKSKDADVVACTVGIAEKKWIAGPIPTSQEWACGKSQQAITRHTQGPIAIRMSIRCTAYSDYEQPKMVGYPTTLWLSNTNTKQRF